MSPDNIAFLDRFKPFYDKVCLGQDIHMIMEDKRRMQDIIREEWDPRYVACLTCPAGIIDLLKMAYNNYNEYLKTENKCQQLK